MSHERVSVEANDPEPISIGITRRVKADQVEAFERWLDKIQTAAGGFDGYAGMDVVRPTDADNPIYFIILRFDSYEQYKVWHESRERAETVELALAMTTGDPDFEEAHGFEGWFTPSATRASVRRPARYKMAILTIVGLYPLIVVVGALVNASTELSVALGTLITVTIVAVAATYWVMPSITNVAGRWLFPQHRR